MRGLKTTFLLLALLPFASTGQSSDDYLLADCDDSLIIAFLFWDDTVTSRQITSPFVLKDHLSWLAVPYPFQVENWSLANMETNNLICLNTAQRDSIFTQTAITYWYPIFGLMDISYFECVEKTARRYGFRPNAMGCSNSGKYDDYLEMIDHILELRNGPFWRERHEADIDACLEGE